MKFMEAADPFADAAPEVEEDPFAQADESATAAEEPPVVDREGQPAEAPAAPAEAPATPPVEQPAAPAPEQPVEQPAEPPAAPPAPEEPPAAPAAPQEAPQVPQTPVPDPAPAATAAPADPPADPPAEDGDSGKQIRHYKVMYQSGEKQWTEAPLDSPPEGVKVVTIDGEQFIEARNNEHALRLAYAVIGSPREGASIWPVPRGGFKPKRVKPAPARPERERLEIS